MNAISLTSAKSSPGLLHQFAQDWTELVRYRELLFNLVSRDLKGRYKRSVLGIFWTFLNPLLTTGVFVIVFSTVFHLSGSKFSAYFLSGYLLWNFFAQTVTTSMSALLANAPLLKRVYLPRHIFIVSTLISGLVNFLLSLLFFAPILLITGNSISWTVLVLPLPLLLIVLFTLGLALALCSLAMFFNDVIHFFGAVLMIWFYLTPIVYPLDTIPAQYRFLIWLNPLTWFVEAFRAPIYNGVLPDFATLLIATCISLVMFTTGWFVFSRSADRFIYYL